MKTQLDTSQWKPALQQLWQKLPQDIQSKLTQEGPQKAQAWLEEKLSREIDLRGTVGAGKLTGRADKIRSPQSPEIAQAPSTEAANDLQRMLRNPFAGGAPPRHTNLSHPEPHQHAQAHESLDVSSYNYGGKHDHDHGHGGAGKSQKKANLSKVGKQKYDTTGITSEGTTVSQFAREAGANLNNPEHRKQLNTQLEEHLNKSFGKNKWSFEPPFHPKDSVEALSAKIALISLSGVAKSKSAEGDHVVQMDDGPHQMTVRRDRKGNVVATDHGKGAPQVPASSKFSSVKEAKRALAEFGVEVIQKGADGKDLPPKDFSLQELQKIHAGFQLMSPEERESLKGTRLTRYNTVHLPRHKNLDAAYIAKPSGYPIDKSKPPKLNKEMQVADSMFAKDQTRFVGSGKPGESHFPSSRVAVHEAGHALEFARLWEKNLKRNQAAYQFNQAVKKGGSHKLALEEWKTSLKGLPQDQKKALKAYHSAVAKVEKKLSAFAKFPKKMDGRTKKALDQAIQRRDMALAQLPEQHPAHAAANKLKVAQDKHIDRAHELARANVELSKAGVIKKNSSKSFQLMNFEKFVKDNKIPAFTDYATGSKAEFYAEAFSLFRTDPEWMKTNSPLLFEFFNQGHHLTDGWSTASKTNPPVLGQSVPISPLEEMLRPKDPTTQP